MIILKNFEKTSYRINHSAFKQIAIFKKKNQKIEIYTYSFDQTLNWKETYF